MPYQTKNAAAIANKTNNTGISEAATRGFVLVIEAAEGCSMII